MKRSTILLLPILAFLLSGCATMKNVNIGTDFEKSVKAYLNLLRWQEYDNALSKYGRPALQEEYRKRIEKAADVKIVDYRVKREECDPVTRRGTVVAELDYYRPPSVTVKTVTDTQKWVYEEINESSSWRLETLLPVFK